MEPKIIKTKDYIEFVGHYDDIAKCAKLSALASLYAIESKVGYAKFPIEYETDIYKALNCSNIFAYDYIYYFKQASPSGYNSVINVDLSSCDYIVFNNQQFDNNKDYYVEGFGLYLWTYYTSSSGGRMSIVGYPFDDSEDLYSNSSLSYNTNHDIYVYTSEPVLSLWRTPGDKTSYSEKTLSGYGQKMSINTTYSGYGTYYISLAYNNSSSYTINFNITLLPSTPQSQPSISIGAHPLSASYIGTSEVNKIYHGASLLYEKQAPTTSYSVTITESNIGQSLNYKSYLRVYDGQDATGTLLINSTGNTALQPTTVVCTTGYLYVRGYSTQGEQYTTTDIEDITGSIIDLGLVETYTGNKLSVASDGSFTIETSYDYD